MKPREGYRMIRQIYDMVPDVECKGLCHDSCTSIDATDLERDEIRRRHGIELGPKVTAAAVRALIAADRTPRCPALGSLNTCTIYADRPLICRLYGADAAVACEHGCVPEGGWLTVETGTEMIDTVDRISREHLGGAGSR